jgi:hypothetical protein
MFIYHLVNTVLEQNHELVKGIHLPLQLNAIDEVNRYRNLFLPKDIQERVLKRLPFSHVWVSLFLTLVVDFRSPVAPVAHHENQPKRLKSLSQDA